ncbi:MAG: class I SAM-dependent methyltransferase [Clostridiales bacterium]|nr:class I SAM-dependent methyltransferase [Clostridiales bacterium]
MNENNFSGLGKIYSEFRPNYPIQLIDFIFSETKMNKNSIVADIGSGTGKFSLQIINRVKTLYGIEPNNDMRKEAEKELNKFKNFISVNAAAEDTGLENESVNFITAAQSFHWFDKKQFKSECRRILKHGGKIILLWNSRKTNSEADSENDIINRAFCPEYKGFSRGINNSGSSEISDFFNGKYILKSFENTISYDLRGFIGRNLSSSYAPKKGEKKLRWIYKRFNLII